MEPGPKQEPSRRQGVQREAAEAAESVLKEKPKLTPEEREQKAKRFMEDPKP